MSKSIAAVLRDAAQKCRISDFLDDAVPWTDEGDQAFALVNRYRDYGYFSTLTNEERSAFLYLCSLIAEDEE